MNGQPVRIDVGERVIDGELYIPAGAGPWPGVLVLHELLGLTRHVREDAADLAAHGFLALAPDLYTGGAARYCMRFLFSRAALANRADAGQVHEIHRCLDFLKGFSGCNSKLGMVGMCLTGGFVLQMARRPDMAAPVVYHHSLGLGGSGLPPGDAADVAHVVQGHYAGRDPVFCPRSRVRALERELGERFVPYVYEGVGHGIRSLYRKTPQARQAWERTVAFFCEQLTDVPGSGPA